MILPAQYPGPGTPAVVVKAGGVAGSRPWVSALKPVQTLNTEKRIYLLFQYVALSVNVYKYWPVSCGAECRIDVYGICSYTS